jgi:hypothetical protein
MLGRCSEGMEAALGNWFLPWVGGEECRLGSSTGAAWAVYSKRVMGKRHCVHRVPYFIIKMP